MMALRSLGRIALLLAAMLLLTSCLDEIGALLEIIAFEESSGPEVRRTGEVLRDIREEREFNDALQRYAETGDPRFLEDARALRPDDTQLAAYDVTRAMQGGDAAEIEAAKAALALAEARRLQALDNPDFPFEPTAEMIRRNVLGEILVAQINLLGGSLNRPWDPPGPDASPANQQLYDDYCETRRQILTDHGDDLSYIPNPPCPGL